MKFKDYLVPIGLTVITFVLINKFFFSSPTEVNSLQTRSGEQFSSPTLNREIDFVDEKRRGRAEKTEVETDLAKFVFTTDGGTLDRLEMKRTTNGTTKLINTVFPVDFTRREDSCFLVALDEKTPFYYDFVDTKETESEIKVHYRYSSADVNVDKIYTIFKETNKVNLTIEVDPKKAAVAGVVPRLLFPSPYMADVAEAPSAVLENKKGKITKISGTGIEEKDWWHSPTLFGSENKYFSHTMVADRDQFVQQAFFRGKDDKKIVTILEGPKVTEKTSWTLSFYVGPKEDQAVVLVDSRLEQTLGYSGWFYWFSKLLLSILKYFYKYLGSYGWAIILLTVLMRLLMLPFTYKSEQSNKKRVELQRKLKYLEQKYKHDKELLAREKAELIKKHGMPGLGGCLPLLFQLPLFIGLSSALRSSVEFYQAPFFIWSDLSAPDPYYILPLLMAGAMVLQGLLGDKSTRMMFIVMGLVFGVFLKGLSAGLLLYISVSTLLGLAQTTIQKKLKKA